jgi:hypothetical protein
MAYYTFQDLMVYLQSTTRSGVAAGDKIDYKQAGIDALEELIQYHHWSYYRPVHRIELDAAYSTGTVTYVDSTKVLTTTGTWPSWAAKGRVKINNEVHIVKSRTSDTDIVLDDTICPNADISTATTYVIYRSKYPLPDDLRHIESVLVEDGAWATSQVDMSAIFERERWAANAGQPWAWAICPDPDTDDTYCLWIEPYPDTQEPIGFIYRRAPRAMKWTGTEPLSQWSGFAATAADTTLTIGSGLDSSMVGSIVRIGSSSLSSQNPTPTSGDNPYVEEHKILTVSGNDITIDSPGLANAFTDSRVVITDPCDITRTMRLALQELAVYNIAKYHGGKANFGSAQHLIKVAIENDNRVLKTAGQGFSIDRWAHWKQFGTLDIT